MWFKTFCLNETIHKHNPEVLCNSVTTEIKNHSFILGMETFIFLNTESLLIPQFWDTHIKSFKSRIVLLSTHLLHSHMSCSGKNNWKVTVTRKED